MCLQRKKVHGVLRGAVRSVSKWLAVHCIGTPVLPLQRVFPQMMRPKQDRKSHSGLRQGQATRLSARRPAQRPATDWGRHTAGPDALKTGRCKQTFTHFNVLPTQYDREKRFSASAKAKRCTFQCIARPSVRRQVKPLHLFKYLNKSLLPLTVEGPAAPPPSSVPCTLTGEQRSSSHVVMLLPSLTLPKQTLVAAKNPRTFVGTPRGCGFHPSYVDG